MHMGAGIVASEVPLALAVNDKIERIELEHPPRTVADFVLAGQAHPLPAGQSFWDGPTLPGARDTGKIVCLLWIRYMKRETIKNAATC